MVAVSLFFSQIAQINRVHRTHRNLKVIDDTEPLFYAFCLLYLCVIVKIFHTFKIKTSTFGFEKTPNWLAKDAL